MAVNASPMYKKAEERYRGASSPAEKLAALEDMLRLVPKHKASEKLQQQIKQRIKNLREDAQRGAKASHAGAGAHDPFAFHRAGAGAVVLLGAANSGKSSIVGALTNAKVDIADFPFSTHAAVPGIAHHEDVPIQLVDMPPLMDGRPQPGMMAAYRRADAILIVLDLAAIELVDQFEQCLAVLKEHHLRPVSTPEPHEDAAEDLDAFDTAASHAADAGGDAAHSPGAVPASGSVAALAKRVLVAANKSDTPGALDNLATLRELCPTELNMIPVSAKTGEGLPKMMAALFELLHVVRAYAKKPGKPADKEAPFILPVGATVHDMAELVHKDVADKLKHARIWGGTVHDGQQVTAQHALTDGNVVELHT